MSNTIFQICSQDIYEQLRPTIGFNVINGYTYGEFVWISFKRYIRSNDLIQYMAFIEDSEMSTCMIESLDPVELLKNKTYIQIDILKID